MAAAFKQSDVSKALRACQKNGCEPSLVEISSDGKIQIHIGGQTQASRRKSMLKKLEEAKTI